MPSTTPPTVDLGPVAPLSASPDEPLLELDQIQGNVLVGFANTHQTLLCLKIADGALQAFRSWLEVLVPEITSAATMRAWAPPDERDPVPAALNIAFSHAVLRRLTAAREGDLAQRDFDDPAFIAGMAQRSTMIGDPSDPAKPGHASQWVVGTAGVPIDCMLIIAASDASTIKRRVATLQRRLPPGVTVVWQDDGVKLSGHEHFGFADGISQPGVRGQSAGGAFLTARPGDPNQGSPGQDLIWPGEFVFGYIGQDPTNGAKATTAAVSGGPTWARNGSLLVYRRLYQDVFAFRDAAATQTDHELASAQRVGRWKSGAPLVATPTADDPVLGGNSNRNNVFDYQASDPNGSKCPFTAHIRKSYARDAAPLSQVRRRRLLRRGIPWGPPARGVPDLEDRGLLFLAYQTSFERQFEGVMGQINDSKNGRDALMCGDFNGKPFVVATGGEYLFAPSIAALVMLSKR